MFAQLLDKYFPAKKAPQYSWRPVPRSYIRDQEIAHTIYDKGYAVAGTLDADTLQKVAELYAALHDFQKPNGGMFYSVYSKDVEYRRKVHDGLAEILKPMYESLFKDYKVVLNSFIVKVSGPESEFCLHQDSTSIDETQYSNLSVWIPLQDTDMTNGCLCVVPHSHKMFSPFRGISFDQPFENISSTVRQYLQPVILKKGEILLFDNRLVHNSVINSSGANRAVVMAGIYPIGVPVIACFKDPDVPDSQIELIEQDDDYLITYQNFFQGCRCRPETGQSIGFIDWDTRSMTEPEFIALCKKYDVHQTNIPALLTPTETQTALDNPTAR